jgi:hypothetical protein
MKYRIEHWTNQGSADSSMLFFVVLGLIVLSILAFLVLSPRSGFALIMP